MLALDAIVFLILRAIDCSKSKLGSINLYLKTGLNVFN